MLFRQIFDSDLAQYAYLVGCQKTGEALVIDPERDIDRYTEMAEGEGLRITAVAETHIHADFLSGAREFADRHGVKVYLSDEGPAEWKYEWARTEDGGSAPDLDVEFLHHGDTFQIGKIELQAVHTPGHTPEHLSFVLVDRGGGAQTPMGIASGDFVFVGDLGRPDLLESAAGQQGAMEPAARQLFESLPRFLELDAAVQVWPAHGAGSACGKALGAVPTSTVGYERQYNQAIQHSREGEEAFVDFILDAQPEPPLYFARMKRQNKEGPPLLGEVPEPRELSLEQARELCRDGAVPVDVRESREAFLAGHLTGSLYAPLGTALGAVAGSYVEEGSKIVLVAEAEEVDRAVRGLIRIGLDEVSGYLPPDALASAPDDALEQIRSVDFEALAEKVGSGGDGATVLDVRGVSEYREGHIPEAVNVAHTRLAERLDEIPRDGTVYVHCASGQRASFAAAKLAREGFDVVHVGDLWDPSGQQAANKLAGASETEEH